MPGITANGAGQQGGIPVRQTLNGTTIRHPIDQGMRRPVTVAGTHIDPLSTTGLPAVASVRPEQRVFFGIPAGIDHRTIATALVIKKRPLQLFEMRHEYKLDPAEVENRIGLLQTVTTDKLTKMSVKRGTVADHSDQVLETICLIIQSTASFLQEHMLAEKCSASAAAFEYSMRIAGNLLRSGGIILLEELPVFHDVFRQRFEAVRRILNRELIDDQEQLIKAHLSRILLRGVNEGNFGSLADEFIESVRLSLTGEDLLSLHKNEDPDNDFQPFTEQNAASLRRKIEAAISHDVHVALKKDFLAASRDVPWTEMKEIAEVLERFMDNVGGYLFEFKAADSDSEDDIPVAISEYESEDGKNDAIVLLLRKAFEGIRKRNKAGQKIRTTTKEALLIFADILNLKYGNAMDVRAELNASGIQSNVVLVTHNVPTGDIASVIADPRFVGLLRVAGSSGDHQSIVTRGKGKIGIVGLRGILDTVQTGDTLILNGKRGRVTANPSPHTVQEANIQIQIEQEILDRLDRKHLEEVVIPGTTTPARLFCSTHFPAELASLLNRGIDGNGLVRSEFIYIEDRDTAPQRDELIAIINSLVEATGDRPLLFRTIDFCYKEDDMKAPAYLPMNEALRGRSGLPLCLEQTTPVYEMFMTQLEAFYLSKAKFVMFPMVMSAAMFADALKLAALAKKRLGDVPTSDLVFGAVIEHPSIFSSLNEIATTYPNVFFSIGTNDLARSLTGSDLGRKLEGQFHPLTLSKIQEAFKIASAAGKKIGVCGLLPSDWRGLIALAAIGIPDLSFANFESAALASEIFPRIDRPSLDLLLQKLMMFNNGRAVMQEIENFTLNQIRDGRWALEHLAPVLFDETAYEYFPGWNEILKHRMTTPE